MRNLWCGTPETIEVTGGKPCCDLHTGDWFEAWESFEEVNGVGSGV